MKSDVFHVLLGVLVLTLAIRGFLQVYNPTTRGGRIRVTNGLGREFWMPLWWRPITMTVSISVGMAAVVYLALLFFY